MTQLLLNTWQDWQAQGHPERLLAVLGHSLWQSALLAAGLWFVLRGLPARQAGLRYAAALATLPLLLVAMAVTWSVLSQPARALETPSFPAAAVEPGVHTPAAPAASRTAATPTTSTGSHSRSAAGSDAATMAPPAPSSAPTRA